MLCPVCYSDEVRVARTEQHLWGIRRIRHCTRCRHQWPTSEMNDAELARLRRLEERAKALAAELPTAG